MVHRPFYLLCGAWCTVMRGLGDGACTPTFENIITSYLCSITTLAHIIPWQQKYLMFTCVATLSHGNYWGMHAAQSRHINLHGHGYGIVANTIARISQWCRLRTYASLLVSHLSIYSCPPWQNPDECLASKVARLPNKTFPQFPKFITFPHGVLYCFQSFFIVWFLIKKVFNLFQLFGF